jgi:hypothetical protein
MGHKQEEFGPGSQTLGIDGKLTNMITFIGSV